VPFTVGGGVAELEDARSLLRAGADKVAVNRAALERPWGIAIIDGFFVNGSARVVAAAAARRAAATVANARALQAYLAAHRELTTGAAFPRATPYLRTATDQSESR